MRYPINCLGFNDTDIVHLFIILVPNKYIEIKNKYSLYTVISQTNKHIHTRARAKYMCAIASEVYQNQVDWRSSNQMANYKHVIIIIIIMKYEPVY